MSDSEDSSYYEQTLKRALVVSSIPDDFDPNKIPQTGEEYLHHVMYEANRCEESVMVNISSDKLTDKLKIDLNLPVTCVAAPERFIPSPEWEQHQVAHFSAVRLHIQKLKSQNTNVKYVQFMRDPTIWKQKVQTEPKLTDLLSIQAKNFSKILEFIIVWLEEIEEGQSINYSLGSWLFAILACLEFPLMPSDCHILREIARKCSEIRLKLDSNTPEEMYKPLNLFICIIARYFNNNDLLDSL